MEGIKMGQQGPGQYPMYQQPYQPPHRSPSEMMRSLVSDTLLAIALALGVLLFMIGSWVMGLADSEGGMNAGQIIGSLGIFLLTLGSLLGALLRNDLDKNIRAAMILFATVMIAFVGFWYFYLNF